MKLVNCKQILKKKFRYKRNKNKIKSVNNFKIYQIQFKLKSTTKNKLI